MIISHCRYPLSPLSMHKSLNQFMIDNTATTALNLTLNRTIDDIYAQTLEIYQIVIVSRTKS